VRAVYLAQAADHVHETSIGYLLGVLETDNKRLLVSFAEYAGRDQSIFKRKTALSGKVSAKRRAAACKR
jgi:hypothetical protein